MSTYFIRTIAKWSMENYRMNLYYKNYLKRRGTGQSKTPVEFIQIKKP